MAHATNSDSGAFSRSFSSPELQSLVSSSSPRQSSRPFNQRPQLDKALPNIPSFDVPSFNSGFELDTSLFLKSRPSDNAAATPTPVTAEQSQDDLGPRLRLAIPRSRTGNLTTERPKSWLHGLRSAKETPPEERQRPATAAADYDPVPDGRNSPHAPSPQKGGLTASTSEKSFASFAKKSWISRTPSPKSAPTSPLTKVSGTKAESKLKVAKTPSSHERSLSPAKDRVPPEDTSNKTTPKAFSRAGNYLAKIRPNKTSTLPTKGRDYADSDHSCASSATSLGGTGPQSIDSQTSQSTYGESNTTTPITDDSSSEMPPAVRDTLWSSFKTLENEYRGFPNKQVAQKIVQIQMLLVPFLRSTVNHPSIQTLNPDDVDRRATILNKWWSAVLEMLNSQTQPPVPGVDRPILLEAATMLMMRPEWRRTTSSFQPLAERSPMERIRTRSWTNSSDSTFDSAESALLAESAEHSVRTMFTSNLVKQIAIVVEKMSLRHAPLSLVNFAGKTCAYAFFFAPGVADVLIRLWGLTPELIRRVADEFHLPRKDSGESEDIVALFPPKLAGFGWTSPRAAWNTIKQIPKMTVLVARIPWTGPWVARWKGRDTDLFFIFCKYFHILSDQFMPPGLPLTEKARSPAFVFVQAQVLNIIDTTIHRQAALQHHNAPSMIDSMNGADASALAMPLPASNIMKGMSENRAVVLLKDVLNDNSTENLHARVTFAEAFSSLMMAATKRTSLFNNPACLTLCDLLEEVLAVYNDFEDAQGMQNLIDWNFWLDVCKKVMTSMNTMSEVRMLSFLFTIWNTAAKDPRRKTALCKDWLLTEETFNSLFNNWCPMVRAYYQRLLCWRICRDDGNATETDNEILLLATTRLKSVWAHYLYLKETANAQCRAGPSTAPMSPTLGKRFIIIRQEVNTPQPGLFMGFDTFARSSSSTSSLVPPVGFFDSSIPKTDSKKRWSLLGKVLSFTSGEDGADGFPRNKSFDDSLALARREVAENARNRPNGQTATPPPTTPVKSSASSFGSEDSGGSTPIVVDEQKYVFKFVLGWQQQQNAGSRERVLSTPRLPGPAQLRVGGGGRISPQQQMRPGNGLRSISGSSATGLIQNARNASPLASPLEEKLQDLTMMDGRLQDFDSSSIHTTSKASSLSGWSDTTGTATPLGGRQHERVEPAKPTGHFTRNTAYTGQALAEWSQVVSECNSFITRRQDEGITRLCEVEVPLLSVEGFRRLGG